MIGLLLISHVSIALGSIAYATYGLVRPSRPKIRASYALVALTLISGTSLVVVTHQPILQSCEAGLVYLAVALSGVVGAQVRLSRLDKTD